MPAETGIPKIVRVAISALLRTCLQRALKGPKWRHPHRGRGHAERARYPGGGQGEQVEDGLGIGLHAVRVHGDAGRIALRLLRNLSSGPGMKPKAVPNPDNLFLHVIHIASPTWKQKRKSFPRASPARPEPIPPEKSTDPWCATRRPEPEARRMRPRPESTVLPQAQPAAQGPPAGCWPA